MPNSESFKVNSYLALLFKERFFENLKEERKR